MLIIHSTPNPFGGLVVDATDLPEHSHEFAPRLASSIEEWRAAGTKVVWMTIPITRSDLIPQAVAAGFIFHHATHESLLLTLALIPDAHIPPFATHYIGAGGVVIDDEDRLLVVCERYRMRPGRHYKLPGGALHPGEHIADAAMREVLEETGIRTRFERLVCFRHWHGYRYGKSDIYFVCRLTPLCLEIDHDPEEIEQCMWMPVQEYLSHPDVHSFNRRVVQAAIAEGGLELEVIEGYGTPETHEIVMPVGIKPEESRE